MAKKVKMAIVGVGTIGNVHADAYRATGAAEIVALCDIDQAKLDAAGDRLGVAARFTDYRRALTSDADAVLVCVWNKYHREIATAALRAGKHVFLEKPMAMNAGEAQAIAAAAGVARRTLQIGMSRRHIPEVQVARDFIEQGTLGKIYHMRTVLIRRRGIPGLGGWFTTRALSGGGPLIDIGVHWFDLAMWLSGLWSPTAVSARVFNVFGRRMRDYRYVDMWAGPPQYDGVCDVEDYASGFVRFGRQATLSFDIAWAANTADDSFIELLGEQGGIRILDGKPLQIFTESGARPADLLPKFDARGNPYEAQARSFAAACRGDAPPAATAAEGVAVMKLIDAVYASSRSGQEVAIRAHGTKNSKA